MVVHFSHPEFFRCRIADKHLRLLAHKHRSCKFIHLNAEKAPFFVTKLAIQAPNATRTCPCQTGRARHARKPHSNPPPLRTQVLPAIIVFKDGVKTEQLFGFEELGGKDEFRTEVLEHWLATAGCIKLKRHDLRACERALEGDSDEEEDSDDE